MKKRIIYYLLFLLIVFQNCFAYQKTPVSIDKAGNRGKMKIALKGGEEIRFDIINQKESVYYGVNKERQKRLDSIYEIVDASAPLDEEELGYIYLTDAKMLYMAL